MGLSISMSHKCSIIVSLKFPFNPQEGALSFSAMSLNDSVSPDNENDRDEDTKRWWCGRLLDQIGQAWLKQ